MGRGQAVLGGLLSGIGQGWLLSQQIARDRAREFRQETWRQREIDERYKHERGLLSNVMTDEWGNVRGITRGGTTTDLGFKAAPARGDSGMSAGDKRLIDQAKDRYTTESYEGAVIDWKRVDAYLAAQGRPDLAAPRRISGDTSIDKTSDEWLSAQKDAEKTAKEMERFWKFDTTVFEPFGGETKFIRDKTMEYYLADKGIAAGGTKPAVSGTRTNGRNDTYKSAEEVGEAYRAGRITYAEAERIVRQQFGY